MTNANSATWRRSTRCATSNCVEVARLEDHYLIRDSKNPDAAILRFNRDEWEAFREGVTAGDFDL